MLSQRGGIESGSVRSSRHTEGSEGSTVFPGICRFVLVVLGQGLATVENSQKLFFWPEGLCSSPSAGSSRAVDVVQML